MVYVYFESEIHAELVATFDCEETYDACYPALEAMAKEARMIVTESVDEDVEASQILSLRDKK